MESEPSTQEIFESAVSIVRNLPKEGPVKPSDELKLKLYAYFKQATHGPNDTAKPRFYQIVESYKWDAWLKLGDMTKEEAMLNYIGELKAIMESVPRNESSATDNKHFEDVLGKKFYDYWFKQWEQTSKKQQLASDNQEFHHGKIIDTQSNSSGGSSVSMLEDTQSAGDGYKTPTSLAGKEAFAGDANDQFAIALLRLQHGLETTTNRVNNFENQLREALERISTMENQTHAKQTLSQSRRQQNIPFNFDGLCVLLRNIKTVHWFYLTYPFLVYIIINALRRRNRSGTR